MPKPRLFMPNRLERLVEKHFGSYEVARAFGQLHYWSTQMPKGFYKFKQPCKHPLYKKGDSWGEDLGMNRWKLDPVFKRLVNHHASKSQYRQSPDKFGGKMFCSYKDCKDNRTYYLMNHEKVEEFLGSLSIGVLESCSRTPSSSTEAVVASPAPAPVMMPVNPSRNVEVLPSPVRARQQPNTNTQTITSLSGDVPGEVTEVGREEEKLSSKKMVELWNSHTQDTVRWYPSAAGRLYKVLSDFFGGCLEAFRKYCASIASSKFLMGQAPNSKFKAWFYWAIKPETIKSIFQGDYGVQSILSKIGIVNDLEQKKLEQEDNSISYELQCVRGKIHYLENQILEAQKKSIEEYRETISQQVKDKLLKSVEAELGKKHNLSTYTEQERGWMIGPKYHDALNAYVRAKLNFQDIVVPPELLNEQKRLEGKRSVVWKKLEEIYTQNYEKQKKINAFLEKVA